MAKKICIAFPHGGIIPASVLGEEADVKMAAMKAVEVPEAYGLHLIEDRFAVAAEMPKKEDTKAEKKAAADKAAAEKAAAEKAAADKAAAEKAAAEKAAADNSAALKTAEDGVLAAMAKLEKAGDDMVAKAAAEDELKVAEAALAALKA